MRVVVQSWITSSRLTMRRDLMLLALLATLGVAACGGTTATSFTPACAVPKACYAVASFYKLKTDYADIPQGAFNDVPINSMGCNAACKTEHGIIDNYLLLGDTSFHNWVEVGETDGLFLEEISAFPVYYDALYQSGTRVSFQLVGIGLTSDYGKTGDFSAQFVNPTCTSSETGLTESGTPCPATTAPNAAYVTVAVPSGTYGTTVLLGTTAITPGGVEFGMKLSGSQGESATARLWDSGVYAKLALSPTDVSTLGSFGENSFSFPHSFINGGTVVNDAPPFGAWIGIEGDAYVFFENWCCS
jgi:hypothetical protein